MPPPRAKLHNSTGRKKNLYNNSSSSSSIPTQENRVNTNTANNSNTRNSGNIRSDVPTASRTIATTTDTPAIEQFELELCWCIQTLENSLNSGKLNSKQAQDSEKTLRSLKSHNQPMVKKRQLMQLAFGDYRRKMADEEKKLRGGNSSIHFVDGASKETATANKGHFVKKSLTSTLGNSNFQFNFPIDAMENLSIEKTTQKDENVPSSTASECKIDDNFTSDNNTQLPLRSDSSEFIKPKHFTSDNSFRFNFSVDCE